MLRVWIPSPNWSTRSAAVRLVVLHTAEGSRTYQSLGSYFSSASVDASSHVGIDDTPGVIGEYVHRDRAAWTQAAANGYSVAAELCGFASWTPADWSAHPVMVSNAAAWVAEECAHYGIPVVRLTAAQAQDGHSRGVCQHVDLGAAGGGHWDCGPDFPMDSLMAMAAGGTTAPAARKGTHMWTLTDETTGGTWVADETGAVYGYDGAPYLGGCNNARYNPAGWPCAGLAAHGTGYLLTLDTGDPDGPGDRFTRYRFPRDGSAAVT